MKKRAVVLKSRASVRRLAHMWVDLSDEKRRELLENLDTESRVQVIENLIQIKIERERKNNKNV